MVVYRISRAKYASSLQASGVENRWNARGEFVIYAASSRSLAVLEMVVHRAAIKSNQVYKVMIIDLPEAQSHKAKLDQKLLPTNWRSLSACGVLQRLGSSWYANESSLVLEIPSVVIPQENNYVVNTRHPSFKQNVTLLRTEEFTWDHRLL